MIRESEQVVLTRDLTNEALQAGDIGTVVMVHEGDAGYELEFSTLSGETIAVVTVTADAVRPVGKKEIAHAREVA